MEQLIAQRSLIEQQQTLIEHLNKQFLTSLGFSEALISGIDDGGDSNLANSSENQTFQNNSNSSPQNSNDTFSSFNSINPPYQMLSNELPLDQSTFPSHSFETYQPPYHSQSNSVLTSTSTSKTSALPGHTNSNNNQPLIVNINVPNSNVRFTHQKSTLPPPLTSSTNINANGKQNMTSNQQLHLHGNQSQNQPKLPEPLHFSNFKSHSNFSHNPYQMTDPSQHDNFDVFDVSSFIDSYSEHKPDTLRMGQEISEIEDVLGHVVLTENYKNRDPHF